MQTEQEYRQDLCRIGKKLYDKGLVAGTNGNLSIRMDTDVLLATPLGVCLGALTPEQLIKTTLAGELLSGTGRPTVEYPLHLKTYRLRSDIRAVVHAHPPCATGMAASGQDMTKPLLTEVVLVFKAIPLASYSPPGTEGFVDSIVPLVRQYDGVLLANHGAMTLGSTPDEACNKMEVLESVAQATMAARLFGGGAFLTDTQLQELLAIRKALSAPNPNSDWIHPAPGIPIPSEAPTHCGACPLGQCKGTCEEKPDDTETRELIQRVIAQVTSRGLPKA
ncbi:MAG: class II aldolase/adducin family protein [Candidatus Latescibacterota bacterium]